MAPRDIIWDVNINDNFKIVYDDNNNFEYWGYSQPGAATSDPVWKLFRITKDTNGLMILRQYANGTPAYVNIFDNYASYSYS